MIESVSPPEILVHGIVTPDDVEKLFKMYVVLLLLLRTIARMYRTDARI